MKYSLHRLGTRNKLIALFGLLAILICCIYFGIYTRFIAPVSLTISKTSSFSEYAYQNSNPRTQFNASFGRKKSEHHLYSVTDTATGGTLHFSLANNSNTQPLQFEQSKDDQIVIKDIAPSVNLSYKITENGDGVKENIILTKPVATNTTLYQFRIDAEKLTAEKDPYTGMLLNSFISSDGRSAFQFLPFVMRDAKGAQSRHIDVKIEETAENNSANSHVPVSKELKSYILTLVPDAKWLKDPARVFPIEIDPSVVKGNAPIATWNFDIGIGSTVFDTSGTGTGNGNDLTVISGATWSRSGNNMSTQTSSLQFDGTNDYASRAYDTDFNFGTGSFSVSSWFRHSTVVSGTDTLMARFNAAGWKIYMNGNGYVCFGIDDDATFNPDDSACSTSQQGSYADSKWHHIEAVKSGTTSISLYIDGQLVGTDTSIAATATLNGTTPTLYLGIDSDGGNNPWTGFIDTTNIYNYARDANQVKADSMITPQTQASFGSYGEDNLTDGLVGWWKMDQSSWNGTTNEVVDSSGNNNHGTAGGGATTGAGRFGKAGIFDGIDDYVNIPTSTSLDTNGGSMTVSVWANPPNIDQSAMFISRIDMGFASSFLFGISQNGSAGQTLGANLSDQNGSRQNISQADVVDGQWHLYTMVADQQKNSIILYVDGKQVGSDEESTGPWPIINPSGDIIIGGTILGSLANESIDDVRIYNRALTPSEIEHLYGYTASPVAYWNMNENAGASTVNDIAGLSNNLTMNNMSSSDAWITGKFGSGLNFDGTNDSLSRAYDTDFNFGSDSFTVSTWINHGANGAISTYTSQPDATSGIDTMTQEGAPTTPSDTGEYFQPNDDAPFRRFGLLKFDLSSIPTNATVSSATLYLYKYGASLSGFYGTSQIFRMIGNSSWTEAATWNYAVPSTIRWAGDTASNGGSDAGASVADTDYSSTVMGTMSMLDADAINTEYAISLSPSEMEGMLVDNQGFVINATSATEPRISTSDTTNGAAFRPKLTVNYVQDEGIITRYDSAGWKLYRRSDGVICFAIDDDTTFDPDDAACSSTTFSDDTWHFISAVKNGTQGIYLYVDGILVSSATSLNATGSLNGTSPSLFIGVGVSSSNNYIGKIDDTKIYNYARTPTQILTDMNASHPIGGSPVGSQVGYWKFDEGYGTTANDQSQNKINLTLSSARWTKSGKFGMAWDGSGPNSGMRLSTAADEDKLDFDGSSDFTLSTWFKSDSATNPSSNQFLVDKDDGVGYGIYANPSGKIVFGIDTDGSWTPADTVTSNNDIYDGNWHYIAAVKTGANRMELYVDGNLDAVNTSLTVPGNTLENGDVFTVGDQDTSAGNEFAGDIDELKIYRAALSQNQVYIDMNQGKSAVMGALSTNSTNTGGDNSASREYCVPGDTSSCSSPVGEWKMDENNASTTYDTSGNGNNGVFTGNTRWSQNCPSGSACLQLINANGVGEGTTVADPTSGILDFDNTQSFTTEVWVKSSASENTAYAPLHKGGESTSVPGYDTEISTSDTFARCHYVGANSVSDTAIGTTAVSNDSKWHHIVCVMDRTAGALYIYVDGVREGADTNLTATTGVNSRPLILGEGVDTTFEYSGLVDNARIYNYARSPGQVAWDYNKGKPLGWFKFDECTGTTVYNSVENANGEPAGKNGTITITATGQYTAAGTCTSGTATDAWYAGGTGVYNSAIALDGTNDWINLGTNYEIKYPPMTLTTWINWNGSDTGNERILLRQNNGIANAHYDLTMVTGSHQVYFERAANGAATNDNFVTSINAIPSNTWVHIAAVQENSTLMKMYVNGSLIQTKTVTGGTAYAASASEALYVGRFSSTIGQFFPGKVDDLRIYAYPLTAEQIKTVYNQGAVSFK